MARLPTPGSDNGTWGSILNDYLSQTLKTDGTLKDNVVTNAAIASDAVNATSIADGSITETLLAGAVQTKLNATGDWNTLSNKPAVIAAGATQAAARTSIGAATATEIYYARDYGVIADGTTNDVSALNSLITTVTNNGGGVVLLPANATILVNSPILMKSNVTLRGQGWTTIIRLGANINGYGVIHIEQATGVSNVTVENLKVDAQRSTLTQINCGIQAGGTGSGGTEPLGPYNNITIQKVWVDAAHYSGIMFLGSSTRAVTCEEVRILDCKVTNVGGSGILTQWGIDKVWIERNTVIGHTQVHADTVGVCGNRFGYDAHITNNFVDSTGAVGTTPNSVSLDNIYGRFTCSGNTVINAVGIAIEIGFCVDGSVTGNHVLGGAREGISFTGDQNVTGRTSIGVTVADNVIDGAQKGISTRLENATSGQDIPATQTIRRGVAYVASTLTRVVDGRRIYECTTSGTSDGSTKPAGWGTTSTGGTVTDGTSVWTDRGATQAQFVINSNVIRNCTQSGIEIIYAHEFVITNNIIVNCANHGVYIGSNANMFTLMGNLIQGNNTANSAVQAGVWIIGYNGSAHVVRIANNLLRNNHVNDFVVVDTLSNRLDNRIPNQVTTPSVAYGNTFFTQNTVPTTISSFLDPNDVDGREIIIRINDANTTLQHSSSGSNSLRLFGGANYTPPSGAIIKFVWMASFVQWVEVSRNSRNIQTVTTSLTLGASGDYIVFIGAGGAPTMPTAVGNTGRYSIKNIDTTDKTISTTSSQTIDGSTTHLLSASVSVDLISDGANWRII